MSNLQKSRLNERRKLALLKQEDRRASENNLHQLSFETG